MSHSTNYTFKKVKVTIEKEQETFTHLTIKVEGEGYFGGNTESWIMIGAQEMEVIYENRAGVQTDVPKLKPVAPVDVEELGYKAC